MKRKETIYKATIEKCSKNATLLVSSYELSDSINVFAVDLRLLGYKIDKPEINIPSNRQVNELEEIFIVGSTTFLVDNNRANEKKRIIKKLNEIFGADFLIDLTEI